MTEDLDPYAALDAARGHRSAVWRFITDFAAYWDCPLTAGDGYRGAELDAAEQRLGLRLPAALREAYELFGRRDDLTRSHNRLLKPDELFVRHDALVYREENQGCALWGILLADLDQDDPAAVVRPDLVDKSQERWRPWESRVSLACVELVMFEMVLDGEGLTDHLIRPEPELDLTHNYRQLLMTGKEIRWFVTPDVLIAEVEGAWLSVRARTQRALDDIRDELYGDWLKG
ncbi:SMI1/KNR4 family protein [Kitasatospora sp. GAS204B]|uniref:SMI1/KNR4 family protein n=1 Tax=unclassified Kitasatospora TaxID=2633591 RepID=UPI0024733071|nr:SMI1/KNR4 family protein [Kitasatospora sp. GAS204B]MDH6118571.1 hypothetical protein [Kitasatospora sp. GAS204B]